MTDIPPQSPACSTSGVVNAAGGVSGQVAERHRLGGDQLARQVVPADLGVRDDAPVRRRDLHDGLAVRPGCSDPHREIGPGQIEGLGEVVRQDEAGQVGVADARSHRDRRPPADEPLSHAGPQSAGGGRGGEPGASRCPIGELCDRRGCGSPARAPARGSAACASRGRRRSARSPSSRAVKARLRPVRERRRPPGRGYRRRRFSPATPYRPGIPRVPTGLTLISRGVPLAWEAKVGRRGKFSHDRSVSPTRRHLTYRAFPTGPRGSIADDPRGSNGGNRMV